MTQVPMAIAYGDVTDADIAILHKADVFVATQFERAPDVVNEETDQVSCHDIVRAWELWAGPAEVPGRAVRGRYAQIFEHSWWELRPGLVLDLYPVCGVRPNLVVTDGTALDLMYEEISEEEAERRRQHKLAEMLQDLKSTEDERPPGPRNPPRRRQYAVDEPGTMKILLERYPTCLWHVGCEDDQPWPPVRPVLNEPTFTVMECTRCGKLGRFPVGGGPLAVCDEHPGT